VFFALFTLLTSFTFTVSRRKEFACICGKGRFLVSRLWSLVSGWKKKERIYPSRTGRLTKIRVHRHASAVPILFEGFLVSGFLSLVEKKNLRSSALIFGEIVPLLFLSFPAPSAISVAGPLRLCGLALFFQP
jgi:hypothetical protein